MITQTIALDLEDVEAIKRLLLALSGAPSSPATSCRNHSAARLLDLARLILGLRRLRFDFLHPAMLGEPAFDMLLALYTAADEGAGVTLARLSELSGVPQSSGLRWVDYLCAKKLISRTAHPTDKRAAIVELTQQGRATLEAMFAAMLDRVTDFAEAG